MARSRLGRGLEALIPQQEPMLELEQATNAVKLNLIDPNPFQPRRQFDLAKLEELSQSIAMHGVLQPIVLRPDGERFQLMAGERRCRAALMAGLVEIPALVKELSDAEMMELAIVENLQREDLNAIEEASAYEQLVQKLGLTQAQIGERVGRSRSHIANTIRLLQLAPAIQELVSRETLSAGHARALLGLANVEQQQTIAQQIVAQELSVRQTEKLVQELQKKDQEHVSRETPAPPSPEVADLEERLTSSLGTQVRLLPGPKRGKIEIIYFDQDELERLLEILLG